MEEIWKDIIGYEGLYQISNLGNVKSLPRKHSPKNKILKPSLNNKGYLIIKLCKNKKHNQKKMHRLIASAFIPNPENKPQINHIDCVKTNNSIPNLEWCTAKENIVHAEKNKLLYHPTGSDQWMSKLSEKDVLNIRLEYSSRVFGYNKLAKKYNVSRMTIRDIIKRRSWTHI